MADAFDLDSEYVILDHKSGARTTPGGAAFWDALMGGGMPDVEQGRLVTIGESTESWTNWEMHPEGEELIVLLEGRVEFVLDANGSEHVITLDRPGRSLVVPRGTWHTARVATRARMLFVTAGKGTQHRLAEPSTVAAKPTPQFGGARAGAPAFIEVGVPSGNATAKFFAALFGWSIHDMGNDNFWAQSPSVALGIHPGDEDRNMVPYFEVADLAVAVARVRELGGTAPGPSDETPGFGSFVECRDPQGVRFGLHRTQR